MTTSTDALWMRHAVNPGGLPVSLGPICARAFRALLLAVLLLGAPGVLGGCQAALGDFLSEDEDDDGPKTEQDRVKEAWDDLFGPKTKDDDGPVPPSFEPIILQGRGAAGERPERDTEARPLPSDESGFREKWELASRYHSGGFDEPALQIIEAALEADPPDVWDERLRGLKRTIQMTRTGFEVVRADIRPLRDYVTFGRGVNVELRIRNVGRDPIVLDPGEGGLLSPNAVTLDIAREDHDVFATQMRRSWTQTFYIRSEDGEPIVIEPGRAYLQQAVIPASETGEPLQGYRVLTIGGVLRATGIKVGRSDLPVQVPLRAGRVAILPRGFEPLAEKPLESIKKAARGDAPSHLLVASEFVPVDRVGEAMLSIRDGLVFGSAEVKRACLAALGVLRSRSVGRPVAELVEPLVVAVGEPGAPHDVLMLGLRTFTGAGVAPDPRLWQDWWQRAKRARTPVPKDEPTALEVTGG